MLRAELFGLRGAAEVLGAQDLSSPRCWKTYLVCNVAWPTDISAVCVREVPVNAQKVENGVKNRLEKRSGRRTYSSPPHLTSVRSRRSQKKRNELEWSYVFPVRAM